MGISWPPISCLWEAQSIHLAEHPHQTPGKQVNANTHSWFKVPDPKFHTSLTDQHQVHLTLQDRRMYGVVHVFYALCPTFQDRDSLSSLPPWPACQQPQVYSSACTLPPTLHEVIPTFCCGISHSTDQAQTLSCFTEFHPLLRFTPLGSILIHHVNQTSSITPPLTSLIILSKYLKSTLLGYCIVLGLRDTEKKNLWPLALNKSQVIGERESGLHVCHHLVICP